MEAANIFSTSNPQSGILGWQVAHDALVVCAGGALRSSFLLVAFAGVGQEARSFEQAESRTHRIGAVVHLGPG